MSARSTVRDRDFALRRDLTTPEGVPLSLRLARPEERLAAFALDVVLLFVLLFATSIAALFVDSGYLAAILTIASFALVNGYFLFFEGGRRGATPGKRVLRIRVIDGRGGPLRPEAVLARNLTRNLEIVLPLVLILAPEELAPNLPVYVSWVAGLWLVLLLFFPLFNRDRLRVGDLIGGTLVVAAPRATLLDEIADEHRPAAAEYAFTREQLSIYGVYELQVLEQVLRDLEKMNAADVAAVAAQIQRKIGWQAEATPRTFLLLFYAAQRAHLEQGLALGERKESKFDGASPPDRRPLRRRP